MIHGGTAHKLTREFPELRRPTSAQDDPHYVAEVAASLGDFVFWLHDQWPAIIDKLDTVEEKLESVHGQLSYLTETVMQLLLQMRSIDARLAKLTGGGDVGPET